MNKKFSEDRLALQRLENFAEDTLKPYKLINFSNVLKSKVAKNLISKYVSGGFKAIDHRTMEYEHNNGVKRLIQIFNTQPKSKKSQILFRTTELPKNIKIGDIYKSRGTKIYKEDYGRTRFYPSSWIPNKKVKGETYSTKPKLMATSKKADFKFKYQGESMHGGAMSQRYTGFESDLNNKAMMVIKTKPGYKQLDINKIQPGKLRQKNGWAQHEVLIPNSGVKILKMKTKVDKKYIKDLIKKGKVPESRKLSDYPQYTHIYGQQL